MIRIRSNWKVTFDPAGTPVVLCAFGSIIEGEPVAGMRKGVEVVDIAGAAFPFIRPTGNRRFDLSFAVHYELASDVLARRSILDGMLTLGPMERKPLRIELAGLAGTYWQFANAFIQEHSAGMSVERRPMNLKRYNIIATGLTRTGP